MVTFIIKTAKENYLKSKLNQDLDYAKKNLDSC